MGKRRSWTKFEKLVGEGGGRQFRAGGNHKIGGRKPLLTTWEMTILGVVYRREGQTFCTL